MDKNNKKKAGLHKDISSIFEGVPVPKADGAQKAAGGPGSSQANQNGSKIPASSPRNPQIPPGPYQSLGKTAANQDKAGAATRGTKQGRFQQMSKKLFAPKPGVGTKRQKAMAVLVPILFIILIVMLAKSLGILRPKPARPVKPVQAAVVPVAGSVPVTDSVIDSDTEIAWKMPEPYPTTLRDPMVPPAEMAAKMEVESQAKTVSQIGTQTTESAIDKNGILLVKGILYSDDNPAAVVGTAIVHIGDKILDATVVKISKDSVEFEKDGKRWTQALQP